jgi:hypothetical protein
MPSLIDFLNPNKRLQKFSFTFSFTFIPYYTTAGEVGLWGHEPRRRRHILMVYVVGENTNNGVLNGVLCLWRCSWGH